MTPHESPEPSELPVIFDCAGERLIGVVSVPEQPTDTGVLILVGGRQYRVGSHRQFVLLSRRLASADFCCLRFDFRGMGDSTGELQNFAAVDADISAALAAFKAQCPHLKRVVLWGLCDAATAAVLYWQRTNDPFVVGLCLVNPWLRTEASLARARVRHYYVERLLDLAFWRKLFTGGVRLRSSFHEYLGQWRASRRVVQTRILVQRRIQKSFLGQTSADFITETLDGLRFFPGAILVVLSGRDLVAKEFMDTLACAGDAPTFTGAQRMRKDIPNADHTFSQTAPREELEAAVLAWLKTAFRS
ncbi:hydrolase 1, exosortase A system-associated [Rugosibacter aromaticivorans]|uniref:hydrolase 1, exosortase A system-associated n=1 Tax=Rugosibacter aromaticivorans TaxID=1565605 RepID=UPI00192A5473|nr:hydrolase 1, exosortase A system-associated [Rugosibacter aromaticivorans]